MEFVFIYPESHEHLGLFRDLKGMAHVSCVVMRKKKMHNPAGKMLEKLYLSGTVNQFVNLPGKDAFYEQRELQDLFDKQFDPAAEYCVAVVDGALRGLSVKELNAVFSRDNVRGVLLLINSVGANSTSMHEIRHLIPRVHWADVYTFDPVEQKRYGWKSIHNAYYSCNPMFLEQARTENRESANLTGANPDEGQLRSKAAGKGRGTDIFFAGGLKGDREQLLLDIFHFLCGRDVKAHFQVMTAGARRLKKNVTEAGLEYFSGGWKPYEEILQEVQDTNVILEILQKGQHGPSLRYYEAVCYNRKLLTNNPGILHLPYYNPEYMKVIARPEDIDIAWIKSREPVDYHYQGDFSPAHLPEVITS